MSLAGWPTLPALAVLVLVVAECFGRLSSRTPRTPKGPAGLWIGVLIVTYAAQLAVVRFAALHEYPVEPWRATMPLPVVDRIGAGILYRNPISASMLVLAALQSYALLALYRLEISRAALRIGCALMLALSCFAPALASFDLYSYVQYAQLGFAAYNPPSIPPAGEYRIFALWYGSPVPTDYGPLWLIVSAVATWPAQTLLGKLLALRAFDAALYVVMLASLRTLGLPPRIRNVAALNPGLVFQYVANGHNDLLGIVLLVWAAAAIRARPALALALMAAAGLVKLPFAVVGLPLLAYIRSGRLRLAGSAAVVGLAVLVSWFTGGRGYVESILGYFHTYTNLVDNPVHQLASLAALALIVAAAAGRRRLRSGVWAIPMASAVWPWYFVWGLPYALARRRILSYLLVCFPLATALLGLSSFTRLWELVFVLPALVLLSILAPNRAFRRRDNYTQTGTPRVKAST